MCRQKKHIVISGQLYEQNPQQRPRAEIKRTRCLLPYQPCQFRLPRRFSNRYEVDHRQRHRGGMLDHLDRPSIARLEARAQRVVPFDQLLKRVAQGFHLE
jgi:hypothetical protein